MHTPTMKKPLKIILIVLATIMALILLITILVSPIAQSYVNKNGEKLIGRKVEVQKLRVNVYGGSVKIHNFCVYEDDGTTPFLKFDTLDVKVRLGKLLTHEINVEHVTLADLDVRVLQNGDRFNFSSILDHFGGDEEEELEADTTEGKPWKMGFYNIRLSHWKVYYTDQQLGSEWKLKDVNIEVPGVYFSGEESTDAGLTLALADGGMLHTDVKFNLENNDFDVDLALEQFAISNVRAYLTDAMNVGELKGVLDADLHVDGNLSELMKMKIKGDLALSGVDIRDDHQTPVLALQRLGVTVNEIVLDDNLFDIAKVELAGLNSHFDLLKNGSNFEHFFDVKSSAPAEKEAPAKPDTVQPAPTKPMQLKVGRVDIHDGQFTYNDYTLHDRFSFPLTNINIQAENVSLSGENNARIFASLPHGGHAIIKWTGTLDDIKKHQNLVLNIKNLKLADISPYSVEYLGQPFTNGIFSFTSENTIRNSQLDGKNQIDLYRPEVGERRKDIDSALHLPLKAALYVLKDKDGKVIIDIPISGNLDNPEFSYMKAVWKTLGNLLVKVATSPGRALANALGLQGDDLEFIAIDPEQMDFTSEQFEQLESLSKMAQYDPSVRITMVQQLDQESGEQVLAKAEKRNQYVLMHMAELGCDKRQFEVRTELIENPKKTGYAISSELTETETKAEEE